MARTATAGANSIVEDGLMWSHAQAPCRIGIAGGGTDLPVWTRERVGLCLSLAIRLHTHAFAITRPDRMVVAAYSGHLERVTCATELGNGLVRESALLHDWEEGFEVHTLSEVSSYGSGLGVSSALAVALAACFTRLAALRRGVVIESEVAFEGSMEWPARTAQAAWTVEIDRLRRAIGRQDHMAAAFGGLRLYRFEGAHATCEKMFSAEDTTWIARHLAIVPLPDGHDARAILAGVREIGSLQLALDAVAVAVQAIQERNLYLLGQALRLGQASKGPIVGAVTDSVADAVRRAEAVDGVHGCKVAGAGGGGHLIVACEASAIPALEIALRLPVRTVTPDLHGVHSDGAP